jgi:predicted MPP superfamily phosphohydrolase
MLALGAAMAGAAGYGYTFGVEPKWLDIQPVRLTLPRLAPAFHRYRVVQLSDIHLDDGLGRSRLAEIVRLVNRQQPDLIAITGDFVTHKADVVAADLVAGLSRLAARDGVVAVLGNHDHHWRNAGVIRQVLHDSNIIDISNGVHVLERGDAVFSIAGVDDVWQGQARLDRVFDRLSSEGAAILLAHEPDYADTSAATGRFDLQLSGHTHGGQVRVPFVGPPVLPPYGRRYPVGRYQVGGMIQYTNRGLGTVRPRGRLNCRPEITVFTFEAATR